MWIAYRKAVLGDGQVWDQVVDLASGLRGLAHAELVFSNGSTCGAYANGVRWDTAGGRGIFENPELWAVEEVPASPEEEQRVWDFCAGEIGCPYDWAGVARFVLPFLDADPDKWFCSELVVAALQELGLFAGLDPWRMSPADVYYADKARSPRN